jgi:basic membrane lipoprotein Med (substrate-binding protein (PBP1-ABC) superfamily)
MRRAFVSFAAIAAACVALAGCGGDTSAPATEPTAQATTDAAAPAETKGLEVRVITVSPTNLGTWDPSNRRAYDAVAAAQGWSLEIAEAVAYGKSPQVLEGWGAEGVDLVISTDNGFEPAVAAAAKKFPDTRWIIMSDLATKEPLDNLAGYTGDWCQIGFAQGVAGALVSKTHKIGYSAAVGIPPTLKAEAGMKIGAEASGIPTQVLRKDAGEFNDAAKAAETTSALMDSGADVITAIVHGVPAAIAARAQQAGNHYIGSYDDETRSAPKAAFTAATYEFKIAYDEVAKQLAGGTFDAGPHTYGIKDGFIKLLPFKLGFEDADAKAQDLMEKAAAGEFDEQFEKCNKVTG